MKAIEYLLAYEHQRDPLATMALKFSESPVVAFNILLAEPYPLFAEKCR
jgi:hypothetical protein